MQITSADLYAILLEVKVYEEHNSAIKQFTLANGRPPTVDESAQLLLALNGGLPMEPIGIRTTSGVFNNLPPGNPSFTTADQVFPRMVPADFSRPGVAPAGGFDTNGPAPGGVVTNASYLPNAAPGNNVVDVQPRLISNLILDQSVRNPAAVQAAARFGGGPSLWPGINDATGVRITNVQQAVTAGLVTPFTLNNGVSVLRDSTGMLLNDQGQIVDEAGAVVLEIPNVAPDLVSAPLNGWFPLFGQGFDHGLDHITKGGNGTVFIPILPGDPLFNPNSPQTNFMVVTRATAVQTNTITPLVDMNQAYGSHPSFQVFLREYVLGANGAPVDTGNLLKGATGGLPTWAEIKAQARDVLGINLTDAFVGNAPLLATDDYGNFLPGANGRPQVVLPTGLVEGNPLAPIDITGATGSGHAFLLDIAHNAAPGANRAPDADTALGLADATGAPIAPDPQTGQSAFYDNELLDRHFIAGDGRVNENYGLTAFHLTFHNEHVRLVADYKRTLLSAGDANALAEWLQPLNAAALAADTTGTVLRVDDVATAQSMITAFQANPANLGVDTAWDGKRLFQAGRFMVEMQYQHGVFEEFARMLQPTINLFGGVTITIDAAIKAEFAHAVYRFGHSVLNETVDKITPTGQVTSEGLIQAFLNPVGFIEGVTGTTAQEQAASDIIRGMTRQTANATDEFMTGALRNNLVGLPIDLGATNIARARELGIPRLNQVRQQFFTQTGDIALRPYTSWVDFISNIRNPESGVNFMAAYGTHPSITSATTDTDRRAAAYALLTGVNAPADALDFINGAGAYSSTRGGLNDVDLWIGGLAEKPMDAVNHLGSTFAFVFENTLETLQNTDRFYYLGRLSGNLLEQIEGNSFAAMLQRNLGTPAGQTLHLPGDSFSVPTFTLEANQAAQFNAGLGNTDPVGTGLLPLVNRAPSTIPGISSTLRYNGGEHVVLGGTANNDLLSAGAGDDTLHGDGGNDILLSGLGDDVVYAGAGNDIIFDAGGVAGDVLHGEDGNDVISATAGLALIFGGTGSDFILGGRGAAEIFAGSENDFIKAGAGGGPIIGGTGDDWIQGGIGADAVIADSDRLLVNPITGLLEPSGQEIGDDVIIGSENANTADGGLGDDIYVNGPGHDQFNGSGGFDIFSAVNDLVGVNTDLGQIPPIAPPPVEPLDSFDGFVEGLVGSAHDDVLIGDERNQLGIVRDPLTNLVISNLDNSLTAATKVAGLMANGANGFVRLIPDAALTAPGLFDSGNVLMGGAGADEIAGHGGNDVIDGDASLQVQLLWNGQRYDSMDQLQAAALNGVVDPSTISIVRELVRPASNVADPGRGDTVILRGSPAEYQIEGMTWNGTTFVPDAASPIPVNNDGFLTIHHTVVAGTGNNGAAAATLPNPGFNPALPADPNGNPTTVPQTVLDQFGDVVPAVFADGTDYVRNVETLLFQHSGQVQMQLDPTTGEPLLDALGNPIPLLINGLTQPLETLIDLRVDAAALLPEFQQDVLAVQPFTPNPNPVVLTPAQEVVTQAIAEQPTTAQQATAFLTGVDLSGFAPLVTPPPTDGGGTGGGGTPPIDGGTGGGTPPVDSGTGGGGTPPSGGGGGGGGAPSPSPALVQTPVEPAPAPAVEPQIQLAEFNIEQAGQVGSFRDGSGYRAQWLDGSKEAVSLSVGGKLKRFKVLGTEESGSGYESMLQKGRKYAIAQFGESGELISSKSVKKTKLSKFETRFEQDFNRDGVVGRRGAALKSAAQLQAGDVLIGEAGRQMHALANQRGDLYASAGDADALSIENFRTGADGDVLIAAAGSEYSLGMVGDSAAIYKVGADSQRDLVAVLEGVQPTNGLHVNFSFV